MKKLTLVIAIFTAMLFAACGNKTNADNSGQDSDTVVKSFEQQQIEASVKMQLDSIAAEISSKKFTPLYQAINNGEITLSADEKKVKRTISSLRQQPTMSRPSFRNTQPSRSSPPTVP